MFTTCLFCQGALGTNAVIEHFPVGRRLAFDADRGRLWVVCPSCERWNLSPLEERWEAIEEAERQYRDTRRRVATDNIALRALPEGLELVRIGQPLRPEFAAWRYGDQFGRRVRRSWGMVAAGAATIGAVAVAGPAVGLISAGSVAQLVNVSWLLYHHQATAVRVSRDDQSTLRLSRDDLFKARLRVSEEEGTTLTIPVRRWRWLSRGRASGRGAEFPLSGSELVQLHGPDAVRALGTILPALNRSGGRQRSVEEAVRTVEEAGSLRALLRQAQNARRRNKLAVLGQTGESMPLDSLVTYTRPMRLALEMALHEEDERRAMSGELGALYARWEEAERIASVADKLLVPDGLQPRTSG